MDDTKCTLFKKYMRLKNKIGTFAGYCRECINGCNGVTNVQVDGVAKKAVRLDEDADDSSVEIVPVVKRRRHNVRKTFFDDEVKVSLRMDHSVDHRQSRISVDQTSQLCCVW